MSISADIHIVGWDPRYREGFIRLNREWIEHFFRLEPSDLKILGDPEGIIIRKGGQIFFALKGEEVVGTCALVHHPDAPLNRRYELAKMAVSPTVQGEGIGTRLGEALIDYARRHGVKHLFLEANTRLKASVKLYHHLGFRPVADYVPVYERCDLFMERNLDSDGGEEVFGK
jgi:GNAT superfamily N-acetyltransferase